MVYACAYRRTLLYDPMRQNSVIPPFSSSHLLFCLDSLLLSQNPSAHEVICLCIISSSQQSCQVEHSPGIFHSGYNPFGLFFLQKPSSDLSLPDTQYCTCSELHELEFSKQRLINWNPEAQGFFVEPPIMDPLRSGQPPYSGHQPCYGLILP